MASAATSWWEFMDIVMKNLDMIVTHVDKKSET